MAMAARVFEDLKLGIGIDESIDAQQRATDAFLRRTLAGGVPSVLAELCYMNGTMETGEGAT